MAGPGERQQQVPLRVESGGRAPQRVTDLGPAGLGAQQLALPGDPGRGGQP